MLQFLRTPQWTMARRGILIIIVLVVAYTQYSGRLSNYLYRADPQKDLEITKSEFRADIPTTRPVWIIAFRNASRKYTYDTIELEATYFDKDGKFLEKDKLVVHQKLDPLQEKSIASPDFKERPNAARGSLAVLTARQVK